MANEISAIKVNNVDYSLRDSSKVEKNQAITGATKCKITYDSKGLVTGGANLEASDIPSLGAGKITSGTFDTTRIPSLAASKITSGTFDAARIPDLSSTYSVVGHNHDSSYVTSVAAITSVSDRGCIEVTKNGSSTYIKVNGWDTLVNSIPSTPADIGAAASDHTHIITLATDSGTPAITLSHSATYKLTAGGQTVIFKTPAGGSGGATLYRHNLEWVVKTGSSPNYDFIHFYGYIITNSSTAYTASSYFGNITALFKKTVLTGGFMDASDEDHYSGIETHWLPSFNKNNNLNGVYINYRYVGDYDTYNVLFYTTTTPYAFTDHVEPNCDLS